MSAMQPCARVPRILLPLIPEFLELRRSELAAAREGIERADWTSVKRFGHTLKGSGGSYGLPELSALGASLEASALAQDAAACLAQTDAIQRYLDCVQVVADG